MNKQELIHRVNNLPVIITLNNAEKEAKSIMKKMYGIFYIFHKKELKRLKREIAVELEIKRYDAELGLGEKEKEVVKE